MGFDYEKVEKAWFKPKKTVLDELEEWIYKNAFIIATSGTKFVTVPDLEDKIQELKKENENGRIF